MSNIRDQYIGIYRLLLFLLAVLVPVFGLAFSFSNPNAITPPLFREILTPLGLLLLYGSYKSNWFKKNMQEIMLILYIVVIIWQLIVLKMNNFNPNRFSRIGGQY